jgi:hypothetical protein
MKKGSLISTEIICKLLELDGFPRNKDNIDGWHKTVNDRVNIQCLLADSVCVINFFILKHVLEFFC